jgi:copper(I)-binding protein
MNMSGKSIDLTGVQTDAFSITMLHQSQRNGSTSKMVQAE